MSKIIKIEFNMAEDITDWQWLALFFMETILIIDFFACFLKIPKRMESPTLRKTTKNYVKTYFFFDLIATCFGAAAFFKT